MAVFSPALTLLSQHAQAVDGSWLGTVSGDWADPANWQDGIIPGSLTTTPNLDTATFAASGGTTAITLDGARYLKNLLLNSASSYNIGSNNALLLDDGGTIQTTANVTSVQTINTPVTLQGTGIHTFTSAGTGTTGTLNITGTVSNANSSGTGRIILNGDNTGTNTLANTSGALSIVKDGPGSWTLSSPSSSPSSVFQLNAGTLVLGNTNAISPSSTVFLNGGTLRLGTELQSTFFVQGNVNITSGANRTFFSTFSGNGTLTFSINSVMSFNTSFNAFTGTISAGTSSTIFRFSAVSALGSDYATFDLGQSAILINRNGGGANYRLGALMGGPNTSLGGASTNSTNSIYTIGNAGVNTTYAGVIGNGSGGTVAIIKAGNSTLTLTGQANVYSGGTTISGGTLKVGADNTLPAVSGPGTAYGLTLSGGTLDLNGFSLGQPASPNIPPRLGPITVTADSTLKLLPGDDTQMIVSQNYVRSNGQLTITGWDGTAGGRILFATTASLDTTELAAVIFVGHNGGNAGSQLIPYDQNFNELVPVQAGPTVITSAPTALTRTSAVLVGSVNPNNLAATATCYFGTDPNALVASGSPIEVGSGAQPQPVSQPVNGLLVGTTYYLRWEATSAAGTVNGGVRSFVATNASPLAVNDGPISLSGPTLATLAVLTNDTDPESDTLTVFAVGLATHGVTGISADNLTVTYDPEDSFAGADSFTYTASDGFGGTSTASVSVTVPDSQPPTIGGTFSPLTLTTGANGTATLPDYRSQAVTSDNVAVTSVTQAPLAGALVNAGVTSVTLTAFDAAGNSKSQSFDVTVNDGTAPTIGGTFTPLSIATGAGGTFALPDYRPQAVTSDNVAVTSLTQSPAAGTLVPVGNVSVSITAQDAALNSSSTGFTVAVTDGTPPAIGGTFSPLSIATGVNGNATLPSYIAQVTATDNVGVVSLTQSPASGTVVTVGTTAVTITAKDAVGNSNSTSFNVAITDGTNPTIAGTFSPLSLTTGTNGTAALPSYTTQAITTDNVGVTSVTQSPLASTAVLAGTTAVTLTAHDAAGNTKDTSFNVSVADGTKPALVTRPADRVLPAGDTGTLALPDFRSEAVVTDNVAVTGITQTPAPGTLEPLGIYQISFVATDAAGNTVSFTTSVEVRFARPAQTENISATATGALAPGAGSVGGPPAGTTLGAFFVPAVSDFRDLVARVTLFDGRKRLAGIYVEDGAKVASLPAFQGGLVPDAAGNTLVGVTYKSFADPIIAPGGAVAFAAKLQGTKLKTTEDDGVWTDAFGGGLQLALREGSALPALDLPSDAHLKAILGLSLRDGELLALLTLQHGPGGVLASNDTVLLRQTTGDTANVLLRKGSGLFRSTVHSFTVLSPALGSPGHGRWHAAQSVVVKAVLTDGRTVLAQLDPDGTPTLLLSTGNAPQIGSGAQWKSFGLPVVGPAGAGYAVLGTLQLSVGGISAKNDTALLQSDDGVSFTVIAREDDLAPLSSTPAAITDPRYASFFDPVLNDAGQFAFVATLKGTGIRATNRTGLWWGTPGAPALLARLGSTAPDAAGDTSTAIWNTFVSYALPSGRDTGPILLAKVSGTGVTAKNRLGIWAVDSTGKLRELLRTGVPLPSGGPIVTDLSLLTAVPGSYGTARSYTTTGSVAALATFADKSKAILRIDLP